MIVGLVANVHNNRLKVQSVGQIRISDFSIKAYELRIITQEMAALVRDTVTKVRSETKEMAVEQQVLLKHIDDAAVAAHMKVILPLLYFKNLLM